MIRLLLVVAGVSLALSIPARAQTCPANTPSGVSCEPFSTFINSVSRITTQTSTDRIPYVQGAITKYVPGPPCRTITAFGGTAGGSVDNTAALAAAIAGQGSQICVEFPPGTYLFSGAQAINVPANGSLTIKGNGADVSVLEWPSGTNGIAATMNGLASTGHVRDMTICTQGLPASGAVGLSFSQASGESLGNPANTEPSDVSGVVFRGCNGPAGTEGWGQDFAELYVSNITFDKDGFFGTAAGATPPGDETSGVGIYLIGGATEATQSGVQYNVSNSTLNWLNDGIYYGQNTQGLAVSQTTFVGDNYGVMVPVVSNPSALSGLQFTNNNCNNWHACVEDLSGVAFGIYTGNLVFIQNGQYGFNIISLFDTFTGNTFWGLAAGSIGIDVTNGDTAAIQGNACGGNGSGFMAACYELGSGTTLIRVGQNTYGAGITNQIVNLNTNNAGVAANNVITGAPFFGSLVMVTNAVSNGGSPALVRLTVTPNTSQFVTGEMVSISGVGGVNTNVVADVFVVDSTHLDLLNVAWTGGTYTSGGEVSSLP